MGFAWNSFLHCLAVQRAHVLDFFLRALSVEMPVPGVHLAVELGKEHESDTGPQELECKPIVARWRPTYRTCPKPSVCALPISSELIEGCGVNIFGTDLRRDQPIAGNRHAVHQRRMFSPALFPSAQNPQFREMATS